MKTTTAPVPATQSWAQSNQSHADIIPSDIIRKNTEDRIQTREIGKINRRIRKASNRRKYEITVRYMDPNLVKFFTNAGYHVGQYDDLHKIIPGQSIIKFRIQW